MHLHGRACLTIHADMPGQRPLAEGMAENEQKSEKSAQASIAGDRPQRAKWDRARQRQHRSISLDLEPDFNSHPPRSWLVCSTTMSAMSSRLYSEELCALTAYSGKAKKRLLMLKLRQGQHRASANHGNSKDEPDQPSPQHAQSR